MRLKVAEVVRSIGYECVLEQPACGGLAMIDICIRTPDGRKIALEVCWRCLSCTATYCCVICTVNAMPGSQQDLLGLHALHIKLCRTLRKGLLIMQLVIQAAVRRLSSAPSFDCSCFTCVGGLDAGGRAHAL